MSNNSRNRRPNQSDYGYINSLARLLSHVKTFIRRRDYVHGPLESWFDEAGRLLIVGQAAHADSPAGNDVAALCVEDAVILGGLFRRFRFTPGRRSQSQMKIRRLLSAFQEMREARWEAVRVAEAEKLGFVTMLPGPMRDAVHAMMHKKLEEDKERERLRAESKGSKELKDEDDLDEDDEWLRVALEELLSFAYDAVDEVETWWVEWGVLLERMDDGASANDRNEVDDEDDGVFEGQIRVEKREHVI